MLYESNFDNTKNIKLNENIFNSIEKEQEHLHKIFVYLLSLEGLLFNMYRRCVNTRFPAFSV